MIPVKSPSEIEKMAESSRIVGGALRLVKEMVGEGLTTGALDAEIESFIAANPAQGAKKNE